MRESYMWDSFQNGTKPDYQGEFYRYVLNNPMFNPGPIDHPDIPVYIGRRQSADVPGGGRSC